MTNYRVSSTANAHRCQYYKNKHTKKLTLEQGDRMQGFKQFLENQQLSQGTIDVYIPAVRRLIAWYEEKVSFPFNIKSLKNRQISVDFSNYLLTEVGLHANTINKNLVAIRKWLEYKQRIGEWKDPIDIRPIPVSQQRKVRSLAKKEVNAILYAIDQEKNTFLSARDRCMIYLSLYRGIRIDEIVSILLTDLIMTPGRRELIIRDGKGGVFSVIDLSKNRKIVSAINDWLEERAKGTHSSSPYLFISFRSGKCTQGVVDKMVQRISERSGVTFTTNMLRHTFGTNIQNITKDIRKTQEAMRHRDINSTVIYTQPLEDEMQETYKTVEDLY